MQIYIRQQISGEVPSAPGLGCAKTLGGSPARRCSRLVLRFCGIVSVFAMPGRFGGLLGFRKAIWAHTGVSSGQIGASGLDGGHQRADTDQVHDPENVVGHHIERHLGADVLQPLRQKMGGSHP